MGFPWTKPSATLCLLLLRLLLRVEGQKSPHFIDSRTTMVHLFEWRWPDIADECERFLGPNGYGGVQISPPNENRVVAPLRPWWERYQPLSYRLETRSGSEAQLREMITRCSRVGVRVYVDAVINHMTGSDSGTSRGTAGSSAVYSEERYPAVPYGPGDFHAACAIEDYNDAVQVRNCQLSSLLDLDQSKPQVRDAIAAYMNRLVDMGVAGFRVDAAKHMWPQDLDAIYAKLKDLNPEFGFPKGARPYIYQEVIDLGVETIRKTDYNRLGDVTEFQFSAEIGRAFRGQNELHHMRNWGHDWGFLEPRDAIVFVDNHDNQRGHGAGGATILTYKDGTRYRLAVAFMLAHPYGQVTRVMSSFAFNDTDQGPPASADGKITSPRLLANGLCDTAASGWVCEHRWPTIVHMVEFRNQVSGTTLANWWDDGHNQIAFARGRLGFVAFNNDPQKEMRVKLQTGLPAGTYCDVIEASWKTGGPGCPSDRRFVVAGDGQLELQLPRGPSAMAIHVGTKLPGAPKGG